MSRRAGLRSRALTSDGPIAVEPSNPLDAAIIAAVGNLTVATKGFGPHSGGCRNTNNRNVRGPAFFIVKVAADSVMKPHNRDMLAALVDDWPGTAREVGQQSLPEIATRLAHRRDALS